MALGRYKILISREPSVCGNTQVVFGRLENQGLNPLGDAGAQAGKGLSLQFAKRTSRMRNLIRKAWEAQ
jgi:hypothetical protein